MIRLHNSYQKKDNWRVEKNKIKIWIKRMLYQSRDNQTIVIKKNGNWFIFRGFECECYKFWVDSMRNPSAIFRFMVSYMCPSVENWLFLYRFIMLHRLKYDSESEAKRCRCFWQKHSMEVCKCMTTCMFIFWGQCGDKHCVSIYLPMKHFKWIMNTQRMCMCGQSSHQICTKIWNIMDVEQ